MRVRVLLAIVGLFCLRAPLRADARFVGRVLNARTGVGIPAIDIKVWINLEGQRVPIPNCGTTTNKDGTYLLECTIPPKETSRKGQLEAARICYLPRPKRVSVTLRDGRISVEDILLVREPNCGRRLPKTASYLPLVCLLGVAAAVSALALRLWSRATERRIKARL